METILSTYSLFFPNREVPQTIENDQTLTSTVKSKSFEVPSSKDFLSKVSAFPPRDKVVLYISHDGGEALTFSSQSQSNNQEEFLEKVHDQKNIADDESIFEIKIVVEKGFDDGWISIYSIKDFGNFLISQQLSGLLHVFKRLLAKCYFIKFDCQEKIQPFYTGNFGFGNRNLGFDVRFEGFDSNRDTSVLRKLTDHCHFTNSSEYSFVPEDFFLLQRSNDCPHIHNVFDQLSFLFCLVFLFDVTSIEEDNSFSFKLNGYKLIKGKLTLDQIDSKYINDYFKLYKWVYTEGNFSDKIGLARNIISLHIIDNDPGKVSGDILRSTLSSYEIYLKQNIKQYIEIKNKISEFLVASSERASKIVDDFANSFKNSFLAFTSFFTSVVILRLLSKGSLNELFREDVLYLSLGLLLLSFAYLFIATWEVRKNKTRFEESYLNLKGRYEDILNKDDINNIFRNDREFLKDRSLIKKKIVAYFSIWLFSIFLFLGIIFYLANRPETGMLGKGSPQIDLGTPDTTKANPDSIANGSN